MKRFASRLALAVSVTLLVLGVLELALQQAGFAHQSRQKVLWKPVISGFIGTLAFDIPTRFAPPGYLWVAEPDTIFTDRYGFRRPELPIRKEPGKIRIAFLGGSTTQGAHRPYPERTIRLLNTVVGTNRYEALNVACSSYSTHQSLKALERWVLPRDPDLVVIYHGWNDVDVAGDGYADHEKDLPVRFLRDEQRRVFNFPLFPTRTAQLLAFALDRADTTWPRLRVPPQRFEQNLDRMAHLTGASSIRTMLFTRPRARSRALPVAAGAVAAAYRKAGLPEDPDARYDALHLICTDIQRAVAKRYPHVALFDASAILDGLQDREATGEFGSDIRIFMRDAVHIYEFAEELLGIELACALAPELEAHIRTQVQTPDYHVARAREFLSDDQVFEAAWHTRACIRLVGGAHPEAEELLRRAEAEYEFVRLFREARWGGPDEDFDSRIRKLRRCLELRPSDFGVCLQIFRVCEYAGRVPDAASAMADFRPATAEAAYQHALLQLRSHQAARRSPGIIATASRILSIRPDDPEALRALKSGAKN